MLDDDRDDARGRAHCGPGANRVDAGEERLDTAHDIVVARSRPAAVTTTLAGL